MFQAAVRVMLKKSVLDPQGKTVQHALDSLGFREAADVRVGKYFEIKLRAADRRRAEDELRSMCEKVLINPVIEDYSFSLEEVKA
jgi:phosphoribosylformylglycinamidine synthase